MLVGIKRESRQRRYFLCRMLMAVICLFLAAGCSFLPPKEEESLGQALPQQLIVQSSLSPEQNQIIGQLFQRSHGVAVTFVPVKEEAALTAQDMKGLGGDVLLTTRSLLERAAQADQLQAATSLQLDMIPDFFCDPQGRWYGFWYDPIVFVSNRELQKAELTPRCWDDLAEIPRLRVAMTDFMAAEAANNLFVSLLAVRGEQQGEQFLRRLHPHIVQYAKFLGTPVRMVALGEADVAVAVLSETLRYMEDKFPVQYLFPRDGTAFLLTGAGVLREAEHPETAKQFLDWLAQGEVQDGLQQNRYYFVHTQPEVRKRKEIVRDSVELFEMEQLPSLAKRNAQLERWIQQVRFQQRNGNS